MNHLGILLKFGGFGVEMELLCFLTGFKVLLMLLVHEPCFEERDFEDSFYWACQLL